MQHSKSVLKQQYLFLWFLIKLTLVKTSIKSNSVKPFLFDKFSLTCSDVEIWYISLIIFLLIYLGSRQTLMLLSDFSTIIIGLCQSLGFVNLSITFNLHILVNASFKLFIILYGTLSDRTDIGIALSFNFILTFSGNLLRPLKIS